MPRTSTSCSQVSASGNVKLFIDLTAAIMLSTLKQVANLDHRKMDSLVVCILTHGVEGKLYKTDDKLIPVDMVCKFFNGLSCPTLVGKPKLFLIQACRGEMFNYGVEATNSPFDRAKEKDAAEQMAAEEMQCRQDWKLEATDGQAAVLPVEADFAVVFATPPGYVSWCNSAMESRFIRVLVEVVAVSVYKHHFQKILAFVNNKMALEFPLQDGSKCKAIADSSIPSAQIPVLQSSQK